MENTHQKKFPSKLSMLAERLSSIYSSSHTMDGTSSYSGSKVNVVTEAVSVLPSLTSTFSLEQPRGSWLGRETSNLSDAGQVSMSMQEGLQYDDYEDEFDNPDYTDTVKSNDSFLRRSLSVPARPNPYDEHRHMKDIFGGGDDNGDDDKLPGESEEDKKWRQTMDDLLEKPEYINSLESQSSQKVLLAKAAVKFASDSKTHPVVAVVHHNYMRALIVLSTGFMQVFLAYMALRNLQSSLNSKGGLGLYVLTCAYAFLLIGCIFAPTIVQLLRPKRTILVCMAGILVFILTNFYPIGYLLLPAACMVGFSLACLWTAHSTYMTSIAMSYATQRGKPIQQVLTKFNGIFFMMFQAAQIMGGALSSVILTMSDSSSEIAVNDSILMVNLTEVSYKHCGASYSHSMAAADTINISKSTVCVMLSIFATFASIGIVVILFCLDGLEGTMKKSALSIGGRLLATFTFLADLRVVLLMGLMCYSFLQMSFMLGEFTKAFVTCSVGVQDVGYVMMTQAVLSALSSFLSDKLQRRFGRMVVIFTAASIQMAMLIVMMLSQPSPETAIVLFVIAGFWGFADGLLITQLISLFGLLFSDNKEAAFAGLKMCQSSAAVCFFVSAPYLDTGVKILAMMVILVIAMAGYVVLETRLKRIHKQSTTNRKHGTPV